MGTWQYDPVSERERGMREIVCEHRLSATAPNTASMGVVSDSTFLKGESDSDSHSGLMRLQGESRNDVRAPLPHQLPEQRDLGQGLDKFGPDVLAFLNVYL